MIGPEYHIDSDLFSRGNPRGHHFTFSMRLKDSAIFNGSDPTLNVSKGIKTERKVYVYVPAAYRDGAEAPILVMQDGPFYIGPNEVIVPGLAPIQNASIDNLMDNCMSTASTRCAGNRSLPAFVAIAIENGSNNSDAQGSERGLEYDTVSGRYARFVEEEVLPAVLANKEIRARYPGLRFTRDPSRRATLGCSSGGAAALSMGWFRPDLFGLIGAYSGTFVDQQDHRSADAKKFPFGAWEFHSHLGLIENSPEVKPLRVFTHNSENDLGTSTACLNINGTETVYANRTADWNAGATDWSTDGHHDWRLAGNRTAEALRQRGYAYRHVFSKATCHCDDRALLQTLGDTLTWLWAEVKE